VSIVFIFKDLSQNELCTNSYAFFFSFSPFPTKYQNRDSPELPFDEENFRREYRVTFKDLNSCFS